MSHQPLFKTPQGEFLLDRFPTRRHEKLQAWDAADELILDHVANEIAPELDTRILLINDSFGALTVGLHNFSLINWSDSHISHQATRNNLQINKLSAENVKYLPSIQQPDETPDIILIKIPKTLALLEDQLIKLQPLVTTNTKIVAGGMIKGLTGSIWKLFERIIGPTSTSLARKKARLIFISVDPSIQPAKNPYPVKYKLENTDYEIINHANVFSRDSLDIGTRFFLQHLPQKNNYKSIIDLGCGNGVLGIMMKKLNTEADIHFVDESYMAIASAKENYQSIYGETATAYFHIDDCLSNFDLKSSDLILCNPPFHQHNTVSNHIALRMLKQAYSRLREGGELWIIGNRHLKYHQTLKRFFGNCQIIASNPKFVIYKSLV